MKDVWNYKRLHRPVLRFGASVVACLLFWATKGSLNLEKEFDIRPKRREYSRWEGVEREEEGAT